MKKLNKKNAGLNLTLTTYGTRQTSCDYQCKKPSCKNSSTQYKEWFEISYADSEAIAQAGL